MVAPSNVIPSIILSQSRVLFVKSVLSMFDIALPVPLASKDTPVITPVVSISQSLENMATVVPFVPVSASPKVRAVEASKSQLVPVILLSPIESALV